MDLSDADRGRRLADADRAFAADALREPQRPGDKPVSRSDLGAAFAALALKAMRAPPRRPSAHAPTPLAAALPDDELRAALASGGRMIPAEALGECTRWQPGALDGIAPPPVRRAADGRQDAQAAQAALGRDLWNPLDFSTGAAAPPAPVAAPAANAPAVAEPGPSAAHDNLPDALQASDAPPPPTAEEIEARVREESQLARQLGYQDGYRDGLAALEQFKTTHAQQVTAQVAAVLGSLDGELRSLEADMAQSLTRVALGIARQVVRAQVRIEPSVIVSVAEEAVRSVALGTRHMSLHLHPDDQQLVAHGAAELLAARGVRLVPDTTLERGGCRLETEAGGVDATLASRWANALQVMGLDGPWAVTDPVAPGPASMDFE